MVPSDPGKIKGPEDAYADLDALIKQAGEEVTGWRPEVGDVVAGKVTQVTTGSNDYGDYPLVVIDTETADGLVGVHCFHEVLRNSVQRRIDAQELRPGVKIAIKRQDDRPPQKEGFSNMHMYGVAVSPA